MWARRQGISLEKYLEQINNGLKRCMKCKEWKPIDNFAKDRSRRDSLHTKCKVCHARPFPHKTTVPQAMREKLSERMKGNTYTKGKSLSEKHKELLRQCRIQEGQNRTGSFYGENNPNWKGGITPENEILRNSSASQMWRISVFKRDKYVCQKCGYDKGGILEAHHIKSWKDHPQLRYGINNGMTVCRNCHTIIHDKPDSYRKRSKQKRKLHF